MPICARHFIVPSSEKTLAWYDYLCRSDQKRKIKRWAILCNSIRQRSAYKWLHHWYHILEVFRAGKSSILARIRVSMASPSEWKPVSFEFIAILAGGSSNSNGQDADDFGYLRFIGGSFAVTESTEIRLNWMSLVIFNLMLWSLDYRAAL